jgi:tetratricopeptide (TPR) repeat protein
MVAWPDFNDMWDYDHPAETERRFRALLAEKGVTAEESYRLQLLTQIARTLSLQGRYDEAHAVLDAVAASLSGGDLVEVRYLLERGRTFNSAGEPKEAIPLFARAAQLARVMGADFYAIDALHMLAIAAPAAEQLRWHEQAIAYAEATSDPRSRRWLGSLYNNLGWTYVDAGRYEEALVQFEKALVEREAAGSERRIRIARWCVGKGKRLTGQLADALAIQRELEVTAAEPDGFNLEEIAECLYALAETAAARPYFRRAHGLLAAIPWVAQDEARMARLLRLGGNSGDSEV